MILSRNFALLLLCAFSFQLQSQISPNLPMDFGPAVWFDAADSSSFVLDINEVGSWLDKSGNDQHATPPSPLAQPIYDGIKKGVYFNGVDDVLISGEIDHGPDSTVTAFAVAELDSSAGNGFYSILVKGGWTPLSYKFRYILPNNLVDVNNTLLWNQPVHQKNIFSFNYKKGATTDFTNGSWASPVGFSYATDDYPLAIGGRSSTGNIHKLKGTVYEIIVYQKALSVCEMDQVMAYLAYKWGLTDALHANQPFKNNLFGLCRDQYYSIPENSPIGTVAGHVDGIALESSNPVSFTNWAIEDEGFANGVFSINQASGEIKVADNEGLDFEKTTNYNLAISAEVNGMRVRGAVTIFITDVADNDPPKQHSILWGANGEKWDPRGRLPDFSFAGHASNGGSGYTYPDSIVLVTDFGAIPNDTLSDAWSFQQAINSVDEGIIQIPEGLFFIDTPIVVAKSNIVLRGSGDGTELFFKNSASDVMPYHPSFSWGIGGFFVSFEGGWSASGPAKNIVEEVKRGDRSVTLNNVSGLQVGGLVRLYLIGAGNSDNTNPVNGTLWNHLHNDQNAPVPSICANAPTASNSLFLFHRIERIEGHIVTLKEPLKIDLRQEWQPRLDVPYGLIENCGIEDLQLHHGFTPYPGHGAERGFNSVLFNLTANCWGKNLKIRNADNGITFRLSANGELKNIQLSGRPGHHGISCSSSMDCLVDSLFVFNDTTWVHTVTIDTKAKGTVVSNVEGSQVIKTDFHRNAPFESLYTNVKSPWNYESSGAQCFGGHSAARSVFWNMHGTAQAPVWGHLQTTVVTGINVPERYTLEREWLEDLPGVQPSNLHLAQLERRLNYQPPTLFSTAHPAGDRDNWWERDPSRWIVETGDTTAVYKLHFKDTPPLTGNRPGEYAIFDQYFSENDMQLSVDVKSTENLTANPAPDFILIANFQDDENYNFLQVSGDVSQSGFYQVNNGASSLLKNVSLAVQDNGFQNLTLICVADTIFLFKNNIEEEKFIIDNIFEGGRMGIRKL